MRFFATVLLTACLSALLTWFFPWWMIAVVSFMVALGAGLTPGRAFLMGFLAQALFWLTAGLLKDTANAHILSTRMAQLFKLPGYGYFLAVAAIIGGLVGGFSAWSAALLMGGRKDR